MGTPRQNWPAWAAREYAGLIEQTDQAMVALSACVEFGLREQRPNYRVIEHLLPEVGAAGSRITGLCQDIIDADPDRATRFSKRMPDWVLRAAEEVVVLGEALCLSAADAQAAFEAHRLRVMAAHIANCVDHAIAIADYLSSGLGPDGNRYRPIRIGIGYLPSNYPGFAAGLLKDD